MASGRKTPAEKLTYEEAVAELEALVGRLEGGSLPLEESVEAYRRGMELTLACRKKLDKAEEAVRKLDEQGRLAEVKPSELRADSAVRDAGQGPDEKPASAGFSAGPLPDDMPF